MLLLSRYLSLSDLNGAFPNNFQTIMKDVEYVILDPYHLTYISYLQVIKQNNTVIFEMIRLFIQIFCKRFVIFMTGNGVRR